MTKYAERILNIINESSEHMTAEQIFLILKKKEPKVVLATVYNNLNMLCDKELIRKISLEGSPDRYDRKRQIVGPGWRHDHLVCRKCGRLSDMVFEDLTERWRHSLAGRFCIMILSVLSLSGMSAAGNGRYIRGGYGNGI